MKRRLLQTSAILLLALLAAAALKGTVRLVSDVFEPRPAFAQSSPRNLDAFIQLTTADTASVLLQVPGAGRTIRILSITLFYSNAANTNPVYVGITTADQARTRQLWLGQTMVTSGKATLQFLDLNRKVPAATAAGGLLLFVSGAASDTLEANVQYEVVTDN